MKALAAVFASLIITPALAEVSAFYEIHVWAWRNNPDGTFADWNPRVSCAG
ncbi:MAG TPA: hypothetical protein VGA24_06845 [Steroidobacteraceae bacterium]